MPCKLKEGPRCGIEGWGDGVNDGAKGLFCLGMESFNENKSNGKKI